MGLTLIAWLYRAKARTVALELASYALQKEDGQRAMAGANSETACCRVWSSKAVTAQPERVLLYPDSLEVRRAHA